MRTRNASPGATRLRRTPLALGLATALAFAPLSARTPVPRHSDGDAVLAVTNCDDSGAGSLRDTIAAALNGDRIAFAPDLGCSVITLTSGPIVIANDANGQPFAQLGIYGPGHDALAIDGGGADRVFVQSAGADALLTLVDLTVTNGRSNASGGCIEAAGSVALSNVEVSACIAGVVTGDATSGQVPVRGGGIDAAAAVTLDGSVIRNNKVYGGAAFAYGGGVFAHGLIVATTTTVLNNGAYSNAAAYGGGLAAGDRAGNAQANITLTASSVTGNQAYSNCPFCGARGGGVWIYGIVTAGDGDFTANTALNPYGYGTGGGLHIESGFSRPPIDSGVTGTVFGYNMADTGAAIAADGRHFSVSRATFATNMAYTDGGAIAFFGRHIAVGYSTLSGNTALARGGGLSLFGYGDAAFSNSTISGNIASDGGAIANTYGSIHVANSTIADNQALQHGGGIYFRYPYYTIQLDSTIVAGNVTGTTPEDLWPPGMTVTGSNDLVVAASGVDLPGDTISADPRLLPLAANGGHTMTQALADGSPAIDAGTNPLLLYNDQRGDGHLRTYGAAPDIGAYEVQPGPPADRIFASGFDL